MSFNGLTQGGRAHSNGASAEDVIYGILVGKGYRPERQKTIGPGIYSTGNPLKTDIYIEQAPGYPDGLFIESKWQQSGGSVDEKFPYLVENIRLHYPAPTIIVYGGDGARPPALEWLKRQVDGSRLVAVFTLGEFLKWANHTL